MAKERVAVVGVGQTKYQATRGDVSMAGLVREAAVRALADAELTWADIDAVVIGKAPDFFEGVMMPELFLADALGATGKPLIRVHTAGSVGGSTAIVASSLVQSGIHERVLTVCFEKQSESEAMWALSLPIPFTPPLHAGAGGYFAPHIRSYMRRSGAPDHIGMLVALKDRQNALEEPVRAPARARHLARVDRRVDHALGPDPLRRDVSLVGRRVRGGAGVGVRRRAVATAPGMGALDGHAVGTDPLGRPRPGAPACGSEDCAKALYAGAGITDPRREIDCAEIYVPFSWFEPMWLESLGFAGPGEGWKLTEDGVTALDGDLPINMSGGVLSSNPIGASGLIRFAEAAQQVRGLAEEHQVDGAKVALGHAYGGGSQYFAMWLVGSDKP